jgi:hypothetical protein
VTGDVTVIARSGSLLIERVRGDVVAEARADASRCTVSGKPLQCRSGATDVRDVGVLDVRRTPAQ